MEFNNVASKIALITGASKGLGRALAILCAKKGYDLFLVSLPNSNLPYLAEQIRLHYKVKATAIEMDLTDEEEVYHLAHTVNQTGPLHVLINNAGAGGTVPYDKSPLDYLENLIKLNVRTAAVLTRLVMPALKKARTSYVLNVSSMAAFSPIGYKTVYPASKAFLLSLTMGLREEFKSTNIHFSTAHPGPMLTTSSSCKRIIKQGAKARFCLLNTSEIAKISLESMFRGKAVIIPGFGNKVWFWFMKLFPKKFVKSAMTQSVKNELKENRIQESAKSSTTTA
ncbi:SDR family NAD(P)-dependent oxidoreductase [Pleomorphovibrio marinus]|uniref:SDR family NAD(P)-dependent oxidoreductase n=1 Tax=Pleomorphovibrio marinus TaxID=2164132 RepID=UPI00130082C6|nr:SDR family NAD(P)-dependent oxidoreductase [Pleomorphovibrio marinus]